METWLNNEKEFLIMSKISEFVLYHQGDLRAYFFFVMELFIDY